MNAPASSSRVERYGIGCLSAVLAALAYVVLQPFFSSMVWASLLAYVSWPAYSWLRQQLGAGRNLSALLAVFFLAGAFLAPMVWLALLVKDDLVVLYNTGIAYLRQPQTVRVDVLGRLGWLGTALQEFLTQYFSSPEDLMRYLGQFSLALLRGSIGWVGNIGWNALKILSCLLVLFFLYRDGEAVENQAARALRYLIGSRSETYLDITRKMSRGPSHR